MVGTLLYSSDVASVSEVEATEVGLGVYAGRPCGVGACGRPLASAARRTRAMSRRLQGPAAALLGTGLRGSNAPAEANVATKASAATLIACGAAAGLAIRSTGSPDLRNRSKLLRQT